MNSCWYSCRNSGRRERWDWQRSLFAGQNQMPPGWVRSNTRKNSQAVRCRLRWGWGGGKSGSSQGPRRRDEKDSRKLQWSGDNVSSWPPRRQTTLTSWSSPRCSWASPEGQDRDLPSTGLLLLPPRGLLPQFWQYLKVSPGMYYLHCFVLLPQFLGCPGEWGRRRSPKVSMGGLLFIQTGTWYPGGKFWTLCRLQISWWTGNHPVSCPLPNIHYLSNVPKRTHPLVKAPTPVTGTHRLPRNPRSFPLNCEALSQPSGCSSPSSNQPLNSKPTRPSPTANPNQTPLPIISPRQLQS